MSLLLNKIINGIIMSISGFGISNQLLGRKKKENWIEISLVILLVAAPAIVLYEMQYNAMVTVFTFVLSIFVYKNYFKESYTTCFLVSVTMMILTAITDIVWGTFLKLFVDIKAIREVWYIMIISNIMIGGLAILLAGNKTVKHLFSALAKKLSKKVYLSTILFLLLSLAVTIVLHVNMLTVMKTTKAYAMALTALAIVFVLYYIYITEKVNYEKLSEEYNAMFHFIQTFEEWIDKEQLGMHEMKNTLSGIRGMTKDKKIINKIDGILKESMLIEKEWVEQLKDIPCGGIKGLFYYKLAIAKTKKVKLYVEVSPKVGKKIKSLQDEVIRKLCILLGIYLDNAIEAASDAKKKEVSLEVYLHKEDLTFVVSNTYQQKPDLTHLAKRGYTTKGPGHGRGLYFAAKTLNKSKVFKGEQQIIDDFFIQKLTVCVTK